MKAINHRNELVHILHMAYSGEKAAGLAYRGHWQSLKDASERAQIQQIEADEWHHREIVGTMLAELGTGPQVWRDAFMGLVGSFISVSCFVIGWFMPMYFAGRLESANIKEYELAAFHAGKLGLLDYERELTRLAAVEGDHEACFLNMVAGHPFLPLFRSIFTWGPPSDRHAERLGAPKQ